MCAWVGQTASMRAAGYNLWSRVTKGTSVGVLVVEVMMIVAVVWVVSTRSGGTGVAALALLRFVVAGRRVRRRARDWRAAEWWLSFFSCRTVMLAKEVRKDKTGNGQNITLRLGHLATVPKAAIQ